MERDWEHIGESGLMFFGKMSASLSHEIKNVMAVINEKAGLLADYCQMAGRGVPPDPERMGSVAGQIKDQIKRADNIVGNLNQLAHSVDDPIKSVDLGRHAQLLLGLSGRLITNRGLTATLTAPENPVDVETRPFLLLNLCWALLEQAMEWAGEARAVPISVAREESGARLSFGPLSGFTPGPAPDTGDERTAQLLDLLQARVVRDPQKQTIDLFIPRRPA